MNRSTISSEYSEQEKYYIRIHAMVLPLFHLRPLWRILYVRLECNQYLIMAQVKKLTAWAAKKWN
jgi:hypothetical protein